MYDQDVTEEFLDRIRKLPTVKDVNIGIELTESPMTRVQMVFYLQEQFLRVFYPGLTAMDKTKLTQDILAAMTNEIEEIRDELPWKHWKKYNVNVGPSTPRVREEIIDLFHFFLNLCIVWGMDWEKLFAGYLEKQAINRERLKGQFLKEYGIGKVPEQDANH